MTFVVMTAEHGATEPIGAPMPGLTLEMLAASEAEAAAAEAALCGHGVSETALLRRAALLRARRERISTYITAHAADPGLTPRRAARALGLSLRSLHAALADGGTSFGALRARARLIVCADELRRSERGAADSIASVAFGCGFNSLATFYRAFRREFGTAPRALLAG